MLGAIHTKVNKIISTEKEPTICGRCRQASTSFRGMGKVLNTLSPDAQQLHAVDDEQLGDRIWRTQQRPAEPS